MRKYQTSYNFFSSLLHNKLVFVVLFLFFSAAVKSQATGLVALGNQSGVPPTMKLSELKSVLMGEKQRWENGNRVIIALMKTSTPIGKATSAKIYDMSGNELNKFWLALVFQGKAQAPNFFNSPNDLENFVAQNPGAIGILDKSFADPEIKSIIIDGQKTF
ncbi:MAG: hypothetical protein M3139_06400 [Bacteroidota bacterium]|nr:hypothetical protein [Bacteroidota bacterium]